MIDRRSTGPAWTQRAVEGLRDQVRLRTPRLLSFYQRKVAPRLPGDSRAYEFADWTVRGQDLLGRLGTRAIHFEQGEIWIDDPEGYSWSYAPGNFGSALWAEYGVVYEAEEINLLAGMLPENGVMVDIGANIGFHSIKLSQRVKGLRVYAFEPVGDTIAAFRRNAARNGSNGRIEVKQVAISDEDGEVRLTSGFRPGNFVVPEGINAQDEGVEVVPSGRIDTLLDGVVDRIDLMKIDVEGHELSALRGAEQTLARFRPKVFVEIMERYARRYGHSTGEVFELLAGLGYAYQGVMEGKLLPATTVEQDLKATTNFLFTHPDA